MWHNAYYFNILWGAKLAGTFFEGITHQHTVIMRSCPGLNNIHEPQNAFLHKCMMMGPYTEN